MTDLLYLNYYLFKFLFIKIRARRDNYCITKYDSENKWGYL